MTTAAPPPATALVLREAGHGLGHELRSLWRHRELLQVLVLTDLRLRYKGSALGFAWGLVHPLAHMAILSFVFTSLMPRGDGRPYPLYLLCGMVPWSFLTQSLGRASSAVLSHGNLLRKVALPSSLFPLASTLSSVVHLGFSLPPLLGLALLLGAPMHGAALATVPALALLVVFVAGLDLLVACANVFFRDVEHLLAILLQIWFWLTPVVYRIEWLDPTPARVLAWNPVTPLLEIFRDPLVSGHVPGPGTWAAAIVVAVTSFAIGFVVFVSTQRRFLFHV